MNILYALALACTLSTAPTTDDKLKSSETSTYMVTDKLAIWLTQSGKLKLSVAHLDANATIELRDGKERLYTNTVSLRKGIQQTFDMSQIKPGTYQIQVTIDGEVTTKTIQVEPASARAFRLS